MVSHSLRSQAKMSLTRLCWGGFDNESDEVTKVIIAATSLSKITLL